MPTPKEPFGVPKGYTPSYAYPQSPTGGSFVTNEQLEAAASKLPPGFERRIRSYMSPLPEELEPLATNLNNAAVTFGDHGDGKSVKYGDPNLDMVEALASNMRDWQGHFRDAFVEDYAVHFPRIINHQGIVAAHLRDRVATLGHVYELRRRDAIKICEQTEAAIEGLTSSGGKTFTRAMAWTISAGTIVVGLASILSLGFLPAVGGATAGLAAAYGIGSTGIVAGTLSGAYAQSEKELVLGGDSELEVMMNVENAFDAIDSRMNEEEDNIRTGLKNVVVDLAKYAEGAPKNHLVPITPQLDGTVKDGDLVQYL